MKKLVASIILSTALVTPALAVDLVQWGEAGAWTIMTDPNHDNGCLAQATLSDGSMVRMGFQDKGKKGFFASFNPAWKEFKLDKKYPVTYMLDDASFDAEARGVEAAGMPGAQVHSEDVNFLVDLAKKRTMTFMADGAEIVKIDLAGSDEAMKQVLACQAEQG